MVGTEGEGQGYYPRAARKLRPHWAALRERAWAELEAEAGTSFGELEQTVRDKAFACRGLSATVAFPTPNLFLWAVLFGRTGR